jgi:hypothetical protein
VDGKWVSKKGINSDAYEVTAKGNSKDQLSNVGISTTQVIEGKSVLLSGAYNLLKKKLGGSAKVTIDDTTVEVEYDNVDKDAVLSVSHKYVNIISFLTCIFFIYKYGVKFHQAH